MGVAVRGGHAPLSAIGYGRAITFDNAAIFRGLRNGLIVGGF